MNVTLTPKQLLCLHDVLTAASYDGSKDYDTLDELKLQISNRILEVLSSQNDLSAQKAFSVWEKGESKKISELESNLDSVKLQMNDLKNKPPSSPGILRKKNKF